LLRPTSEPGLFWKLVHVSKYTELFCKRKSWDQNTGFMSYTVR